MVALLTYILTVLIPINGLMMMRIQSERKKNKKLLHTLWKLGYVRNIRKQRK